MGAVSSFLNTQSHCLQLQSEFPRTAVDLDILYPWLLEAWQISVELSMLILIAKSVSQQLHSDTAGGTPASANLWVQTNY